MSNWIRTGGIGLLISVAPLTAITVCVSGVLVFVFCASQLGRRIQRGEEPLKHSGLPSRKRTEILLLIKHRQLPEHPKVRALAFQRVAYDVTTGASMLVWEPFMVLGLILALCGLYAIPEASILTVVIQSVIVLFSVYEYTIDRRRLLNSRELVRQGWVQSSSADNADSES
jgi:hypothetical protein